jgi:hypothetical protein
MGSWGCPETSVNDCQHKMRNPENEDLSPLCVYIYYKERKADCYSMSDSARNDIY